VTELHNEECHIFLRTRYYAFDKINKDETGGACGMYVGRGEVHEGIGAEM
jgi:hypothetical protein